jgi:hypothetical protein
MVAGNLAGGCHSRESKVQTTTLYWKVARRDDITGQSSTLMGDPEAARKGKVMRKLRRN